MPLPWKKKQLLHDASFHRGLNSRDDELLLYLNKWNLMHAYHHHEHGRSQGTIRGFN